MIRLVALVVVILVAAVAVMGCANGIEPALELKSGTLARLYKVCPWLDNRLDVRLDTSPAAKTIIKPELGGGAGVAVKFASPDWTLETCQATLGVPCMEQAYHGGPYELRLYKHGPGAWEQPFAFVVPRADGYEPVGFDVQARLPLVEAVQRCVDAALPTSPCVAVDMRLDAAGLDGRVLEINGAYGIPLNWAAGQAHAYRLWLQLLQWVLGRLWHGMANLHLLPLRLWPLLLRPMQRRRLGNAVDADAM